MPQPADKYFDFALVYDEIAGEACLAPTMDYHKLTDKSEFGSGFKICKKQHAIVHAAFACCRC